MSPLLERHVLASVLHDFLSNESTEHSGLRSDGTGAVGSNLLDDILINFIDTVELCLLPLLVLGFGELDDFGKISFSVCWVAAFLVLECMGSGDSEVKILRSAHTEVVHVHWLETSELSGSSWVLSALGEALESNHLWLFRVFHNTLTGVCSEARCVKFETEAVCLGITDSDCTSIIEFSHTLDFSKFDVITILVRVALVLVHVNNWLLSLLYAADDKLLGWLTILVCHDELVSIVKESIRRETQVLSEDKADFL